MSKKRLLFLNEETNEIKELSFDTDVDGYNVIPLEYFYQPCYDTSANHVSDAFGFYDDTHYYDGWHNFPNARQVTKQFQMYMSLAGIKYLTIEGKETDDGI